MSNENLDALLEAYLGSHPPKRPKWQWVRPAIAALCTLVGTAFGAGIATQRYLGLLYTKEDARLEREQAARVRETDEAHERKQEDRLSEVEHVSAGADKCCGQQAARLDRILTPRNP
jgi:hypothetical protein